jgi:hypothetical protein
MNPKALNYLLRVEVLVISLDRCTGRNILRRCDAHSFSVVAADQWHRVLGYLTGDLLAAMVHGYLESQFIFAWKSLDLLHSIVLSTDANHSSVACTLDVILVLLDVHYELCQIRSCLLM